MQKTITTKWNYLKNHNQQPAAKASLQKNNKGRTFEELKIELEQKYDEVAQKIDNQTIRQAIEKLKEQAGLKKDGNRKDNQTLEIECKNFKEDQFLARLIENMSESKVIQIAQAQDFENLSNIIRNEVIEKITNIYKTRTQIDATDLFNPIQAVPKYDDFDFDKFLNRNEVIEKTTHKLSGNLAKHEQKTYPHDPNASDNSPDATLKNDIINHTKQNPLKPVNNDPNGNETTETQNDKIPTPPAPPVPQQEHITNITGANSQADLMAQIRQNSKDKILGKKDDPGKPQAKQILEKLGVTDLLNQNAIIAYAKETGVDITDDNALNELYKEIDDKQKLLKQNSQPNLIKNAINALKEDKVNQEKRPKKLENKIKNKSEEKKKMIQDYAREINTNELEAYQKIDDQQKKLKNKGKSHSIKDAIEDLKNDAEWDDDDKDFQQQQQRKRQIEHQNLPVELPLEKGPLEDLFNQLPKEIKDILNNSNRVDELKDAKYQNAAGYLFLFKDENVKMKTRKTLAEQLSVVLAAEQVQKTVAQNRLNELLKEHNIDIATYQQKYQKEQEDARSKMEQATKNQEETPEPQADNTPDQPTAPTNDDHHTHVTQGNPKQHLFEAIMQRRTDMYDESTDDDSDFD